MRRFFKWIFRIVGIAGVVTSILLLFYIYFAPGIAERTILATLRRMGVDEASVRVRSVGASHMQITNLNLGEEAGLSVGAVGVDYRVSPAGGVHVKTIEIIGAELDLRMRNGELDLGPLADIDTGEGESMVDDPVPFDMLKLRAASVVFRWRGRRFVLPVDVTLRHKGKGECDAFALVTLLGVQLRLNGEIDFTAPAPTGDGGATGRAAGISFRLTTADLGRPVELKGWIGSGADGVVSIALTTSENADAAQGRWFDGSAVLEITPAETSVTIKARGNPELDHRNVAGSVVEIERADVQVDAKVNLTAGTAQGTLVLAAQTLTIRGGGRTTALTEPALRAHLTGAWTDQAVTLAFAPGTSLVFKEGTMIGGEADLRVAAVSIALDASRLVLPLKDGGAPPGLQLALRVSPIEVRAGASHLTLGGIESRIDLSLSDEDETVITGGVKITNAAYANSDAEVRFEGISADIPFSFNTARGPEVPGFEIKSIRVGAETFAAMKGSLAIDDGVLQADLNWPLFEESPIKVAVTADLLNGLAGRLTASVHDLRITDDHAVAKRLKVAEPFRVTGTFDLDADIAFAGGVVTPRIVVGLEDANFSAGELDFVANGINSTITLDSFAPLRTLPNQRLAIRDGHLGKLNFRNAIINFRLDAIDQMLVELAAWTVGERGRFWVHAARFNPAAPVLETQVFIDDMSVAEWLEFIQDGKVAGEGWLYGRLPMRIDQASEFVLTFGEGFLYAKPGKGWVRFSSKETTPQQVYKTLEEAIANLAREAQQRLMEAVMDFEFDTLKFDFIREDKGVLCRIATTGRGRAGLKQEVGGLTVNIHNFGALLSRQLLRSTDSVGAIDDAIRRALEGK